MPLGMEVGLDLGDFVLDGELSSLTKKRDTAPNFWHYCGQTAWSIRIPVGTEVGLGPGDIVLDEDPALPPLTGAHACCFDVIGLYGVLAKCENVSTLC